MLTRKKSREYLTIILIREIFYYYDNTDIYIILPLIILFVNIILYIN